MALLIVQAASEDASAAPGNRLPNYVCVSVTDAVGNPVAGLDDRNFQVAPIIVGPGGALVNITSAVPAPLAGFYLVRVVPINVQTWKAGVYIFAVAITQGANRGQALCSVQMD